MITQQVENVLSLERNNALIFLNDDMLTQNVMRDVKCLQAL